jgi:hypothetical protein
VFIHYYTHVGLPVEAVMASIESLREPMSAWAGIAYRQGEELRSRVGPGSGVPAKEVTFELGLPLDRDDSATYPIAWHASGAGALFPRLQAELAVAPLAPELTVLTLQGTYDPPLGVVGRFLDRAGLGLMAEATVKNWLDRVADAIAVDGRKRVLDRKEET